MIARYRAVVVAGCLCLGAAGPAGAQTRPAVFLHGFGAEASDWAATADRLTSRVMIQPHLPELPWRESYEVQGRRLQSAVSALPSNAVAVGHSNGGIVAREWSRLRPLGGIVTIGTPHQGVPLLAHLPVWAAFTGTLRGLVSDAGSAFLDGTEWTWVFAAVENALRLTSDFSIWSLVNLVNVLGVGAITPVSLQMLPGSSYLNGLNAGSQLSREAAAAPNRVGIVSVASNYYYAGPARAIAPRHADTIATAMYAAASTLLYWGGHILIHAAPWDIAAIEQGQALVIAGNHLLAVDPTYCAMVSTLDLSGCVANDGIVPVTSQAYPGAPNITMHGPAHREEKQRGDDALYAALVTYTHLAPVSSAAPAPGPWPAPSPAPDEGSPGGDVMAGGALEGGAELGPGDMVSSSSRRVHLLYQLDGNLVLYHGEPQNSSTWRPLWSSETTGTSPGAAIMQLDGNLVVYSASGRPLWSTNTFHPPSWLAVQDDGNLVVYDANDNALWASDTFIE